MKQDNKDLSYYRSLPYTRRARLERDVGGDYFVAYVEELAGLESDGLNETEARYNLQLAFDDYITALLDRGVPIAEPELRLQRSTVAHWLGIGRIFTGLFQRTRVEPEDTGVSFESIMTDPPGVWYPTEPEVETSTDMAGAA